MIKRKGSRLEGPGEKTHRDLGSANQSRAVAGERGTASEPSVLAPVHLSTWICISTEESRHGRFKMSLGDSHVALGLF